jgi:hypothetical protein
MSMKKIIILLLLLNLSCLIFVIAAKVPVFVEFIWTYYLPMIAACISSIFFLVVGKNKIIFWIILIISLIGPSFMLINAIDDYRYEKFINERQSKFNLESTVEWREANCIDKGIKQIDIGSLRQYECNDGSKRYYAPNDALVRTESPR